MTGEESPQQNKIQQLKVQYQSMGARMGITIMKLWSERIIES